MKITYLSSNEIKVLQNNCSVSSRDYLLINFLLKTGCRVTETVSVTVKDINFEEQYVHVLGKGKKHRTIKLPSDLIQLLQLYIRTKKMKHQERIFPITRGSVDRILKKYDQRLHAHIFRHTYAINLLRKTKNIRYVQKQLGHANLNTTSVYLQFLEFDKEDQQLEELYNYD